MSDMAKTKHSLAGRWTTTLLGAPVAGLFGIFASKVLDQLGWLDGPARATAQLIRANVGSEYFANWLGFLMFAVLYGLVLRRSWRGVPAIAGHQAIFPPEVRSEAPSSGSDREHKRDLINAGRGLAVDYTNSGETGFRRYLERSHHYPAIRPHLSTTYRADLENAWKVWGMEDGALYEPLVKMFLDEMDRLESEWGLAKTPIPRAGEPRREVYLPEALGWAVYGKWDKPFHGTPFTIALSGAPKIDHLLERVGDLAAEGKLTIWGQRDDPGYYEQIPQSHWEGHGLALADVFGTVVSGEDNPYRSLMLNRAEVERAWPHAG